MKKCLIFLALTGIFFVARGQRKYAENSVLSTGQWVKIAVDSPGIYKVTASDIKSAGISGSISSAQIRLFGNGGMVLPESNAVDVLDDLKENAIEMVDGGDGVFDANDYFIFYAPGPHHWLRDTSAVGFKYLKNFYTDKSFYFIQVGVLNGKRIASKNSSNVSGQLLTIYDEHLHHELDSINFLKSGKEWYGEHFSNQAGRNAVRDFNLDMRSAMSGEEFYIVSDVIGSSVNQPNKIAVAVNGKKILEHETSPVFGSLISPVASSSRLIGKGVLEGSGLTINYQHTGGSLNAASWLNWFDVIFKRKLDMQGLSQLSFRSKSIKHKTAINFSISNAVNNAEVWDVADFYSPQKLKASLSGTSLNVIDSVGFQHEYIVFDPTKVKTASIVGKLSNQNLHQLNVSAFVIITDKSILDQANRLRNFHQQQDGISTVVIDVEQVYNEFASGSPDPSALRNFLKMFYDRSEAGGQKLKYAMLIGSASYQLKEQSISKRGLVPSYQTDESIDPLLSYVTDDYFGFLDDNDDINNTKNIAKLDIGIGRLPVRNLDHARRMTDKIIRYKSNLSLGEWRNNFTFVADDEDYNLHVDDAEFHASLLQRSAPQLKTKKIYIDAFKQESNAGGSRYPEVNQEVLKDINNGTLIWNYSGHGNNTRLAYEVVLDKDLLAQWSNENRLSFFITATCDFAPFDDQSQFSLGEDLLVGRNTGAIGMVTTTRLVFASSNRELNNNFLTYLTARNTDNYYPTLGAALQEAKNFTYSTSTDFINARKFTLLGDPAMKLAMPDNIIVTTSIVQEGSSTKVDTLKALNKYVITGEIKSPNGSILTTFNGNVFPVLLDKANEIKTLANDAESSVITFKSFKNILYKGKVKVENGKFSFTFTMPRDIDYAYGTGKLIYYAENGTIDASGVDQQIIIGGSGSANINDIAGPVIKAYLDTNTFKNGDFVGSSPTLKMQLSDISGINLSSASIGHQIIAVLDKNYKQPMILNEYYTSTGSGEGAIQFQFSNLEAGRHQLEIKAWDVLNNSTTIIIDFIVEASKIDPIKSLIAYPNPFNDRVKISAQLNNESIGSTLQVDIYSIEGKWLKHFQENLNQTGVFTFNLEWDGKNMQGVNVNKGLFFIRMKVASKEGKNFSKVLKIIKL